MKIRLIIALVLTSLLNACGDKKVDTAAVREEMKSRELRKIPEADVLQKAMELGNELLKAYEASGSSASEIKPKVTLFNEPNDLAGKEEQLFQAYQYNKENQIKSDPNIQDMPEEKVILYTAPLMKSNKMVGMFSVRFSRSHVIGQIEN